MLLGDLMRRLDDETLAEETVLRCADVALLAALGEEARASGTTMGSAAAEAIRIYAAAAPDEEWLTLMGALNRTDDPAVTCMRRAVAFVQKERAAAGACA